MVSCKSQHKKVLQKVLFHMHSVTNSVCRMNWAMVIGHTFSQPRECFQSVIVLGTKALYSMFPLLFDTSWPGDCWENIIHPNETGLVNHLVITSPCQHKWCLHPNLPDVSNFSTFWTTSWVFSLWLWNILNKGLSVMSQETYKIKSWLIPE